MAERTAQDEQLLIDYAMGRCEPGQREAVSARLAGDADFAALHEDIARSLAALGMHPAPEPADDLVERTLARVRSLRRTEALLDRQRMGRRPRFPTFSLRELGAMAAAAVLIAGILIPSVREAGRRADRAACRSNVGQIGTALRHFAQANNQLLPASPATTDNWLPRPGRPAASNSAGLFLVVGRGASENVFQCPAAGGRAFVKTAGMVDFPSPQSIGYSYQYSLGGSIRLETGPVAAEMPILADATPVFAGRRFRAERVGKTVSENHSGAGQNVLYMDGHVTWTAQCRVGVNGDNIWLAQGVYVYTGSEKPRSPADAFLLPSGLE